MDSHKKYYYIFFEPEEKLLFFGPLIGFKGSVYELPAKIRKIFIKENTDLEKEETLVFIDDRRINRDNCLSVLQRRLEKRGHLKINNVYKKSINFS